MTDAVRTVHNRPTSAPVRRTRIPQGLQGFDKGNEAALGREDGRGRIPMFHVLSYHLCSCMQMLGDSRLRICLGEGIYSRDDAFAQHVNALRPTSAFVLGAGGASGARERPASARPSSARPASVSARQPIYILDTARTRGTTPQVCH